ncbi:hypothetical protein Y032_0348g3165 [Ancylostoma ceylanicum]|uniref:Uncharacterized protein n=1 Tax=Ancylostoma ceylanicum TaxID=53326 RepID=A0A016RWU5_9BILA|nr:hypothetical protein Y032_0348g3165 [Ancylostoma ceylanicum]
MGSAHEEELEAASKLCRKSEGRRAQWTLESVYGLLYPAQEDWASQVVITALLFCVDGLPMRGASPSDSSPFLNLRYQMKHVAREGARSPIESSRKRWVSCAVLPQRYWRSRFAR